MNKGIIIAIITVLVIAGGVFAATSMGGNDEVTPTSNQAADVTTGPATDASSESFTADEVAQHASGDDCWAIIDGSVYDITEYVPRHPGGDEILRACGNDATTLFQQRTTEDGESVGSGQPHSEDAASLLEGFKIGELAT